MSLMKITLNDDLDSLVQEWIQCRDENHRWKIIESHYRHRQQLGSSGDDLKQSHKYIDFKRRLNQAKEPAGRKSYHDMYWAVKSHEDGKAVTRLLKMGAVVFGVLVAMYIIGAIAFGPRTPGPILRQMHPYDPVDDPRSETGGYRTRGL